jgi:tetratricopeptide (TPR) repeat protein
MDRLDAVLRSRAEAVPAEAAGCHRARADMLFTMGRLERAAEAFEAALASDPEDAAGLATLGACLVSLHGPEAARHTDRRLAALAEARPGGVPASLEAEARYRLGLHAAPGTPAGSIRTDLERALWLAPEDPRADRAFEALTEAHLGLDDLPGALSAVRARAERAAARGDEAAELAALERGEVLLTDRPDPSADGAALLDVESEAASDVRAEIAAAVVGKGFALLGLHQQGMSLEDIFLQLTTTDTAEAAHAAAAPHEEATA